MQHWELINQMVEFIMELQMVTKVTSVSEELGILQFVITFNSI